ncbi:MAG: hypothetical protein AABY40_00625 [Nanoarchaeota archaeon]
MKKKYELSLFATVFAIIFTVLTYIDSERTAMWLSLELIILPFIYVVGYEMLMDKQKQWLEEKMSRILARSALIEKENIGLKYKLSTIKKIK